MDIIKLFEITNKKYNYVFKYVSERMLLFGNVLNTIMKILSQFVLTEKIRKLT